MNNVNGFVIRNKPWSKWFFVIVLILSLFAELIIGILIISKVMPLDMAPFLIIPVLYIKNLPQLVNVNLSKLILYLSSVFVNTFKKNIFRICNKLTTALFLSII